MQVIQCAVLAAPHHKEWLSNWTNTRAVTPRIRYTPLIALQHELPGALAAPDGPGFGAILLLVSAQSHHWARTTLKTLRNERIPTLVFGRGLSMEAMDELMKYGAADFIGSESELELRVRHSVSLATTTTIAPPPEGELPTTLTDRLVGRSPRFLDQLKRIPAMAGCDAAVLILGETGTGKELCAEALHYLSTRSSHPLVTVNCAALPTDLIEAELFGHVRGAYTDAHGARIGLVGEAEGGTLFLDEVDSLSSASQAKLLRFLQEKEYRPVGSSKVMRANVRVLAASNTAVDELHRGVRFRKDLFYRLNVLTLNLPALRDRIDDLAPLADYFIARHARIFKKAAPRLSEASTQAIVNYEWPGNVRELQHALERAVLLCRNGVIEPADLDLPGCHWSNSTGATAFNAAKARAVKHFELDYLERTLAASGGNITRAAAIAQKNRRAFWELLRKHGVDASRYRNGC